MLSVYGMKGDCNYEKQNPTFWKIPERNGNAEYRSIHRMGLHHSIIYRKMDGFQMHSLQL